MPESSLVKIRVSPKRNLLCKLRGRQKNTLDQCRNCGYLMNMSVILRCGHLLCADCCGKYKEYVCQQDGLRTTIAKAERRTCHGFRTLYEIILECPKCSFPVPYPGFVDHIKICHPDLLDETVDDPGQELLPQPNQQNVYALSDERQSPVTSSDDQEAPPNVPEDPHVLDTDVSCLPQQLRNTQDEISKVKETLAKLAQQLHEARLEISDLKGDNAKLAEQLGAARHKITGLQGENTKLAEQLGGALHKITDVQGENTKLQEKLSEQDHCIDSLKANVQTNEEDVRNLKLELSQRDNNLQFLTGTVQTIEDNLRNVHNAFQNEMKQLLAAFNELKEENKRSKRSMEQCILDLHQLKATQTELQTAYDDLVRQRSTPE